MTDHNQYVAPTKSRDNVDRYFIRTAILRALKEQLPQFSGRFLDVGSGNQPYRELICAPPSQVTEYTPLDLHDNFQYANAEYTWDGITMPFENASFDCAMATEVLEHCPHPEVTLSEIARVLKPGGVFFFTVPFLWPLHDCPHDEYRYTPWSLERHLRNSGFDQIRLRPTGGWDAALAQALGLWLRRRPMSDRKRRWLSRVLFPFWKQLVRRDETPTEFSNQSLLFPGIAGTARKA